jgi:hypothetical protein
MQTAKLLPLFTKLPERKSRSALKKHSGYVKRTTSKWASGTRLRKLLQLVCRHIVGRAQFDETGSNVCDVNPTTWPESRLLKPASSESNPWFDGTFPEVSGRLDLQLANGPMSLNPNGRFNFLHNIPFAMEPALMPVWLVGGCT